MEREINVCRKMEQKDESHNLTTTEIRFYVKYNILVHIQFGSNDKFKQPQDHLLGT